MSIIRNDLDNQCHVQAEILNKSSQTQELQQEYDTALCLHQLFEAQVKRTPNAIAVIFEQQRLTYQELNTKANQLANYLQSLGVGTEVLVGICLERSLEMVVGLLGILKAGGAYVPLDPAYPPERLAFILEDTQTPILLTTNNLVENLEIHQQQIICLDTDWEIIADNSSANAVAEVTPENLSYVIYTSGSTGKPKGVMITHSGICNTLYWRQETFKLTAQDKVLQTISFSFDPSVWQIFWPLGFGGQLIMARPGGHQDPTYLIKTIIKQQITVIAVVPSMLRLLLEEKGIENCHCLRHITSGGEALSNELIKRFYERLPLNHVLVNCYGPTEAAIDATFWMCQPQINSNFAPIGSAIRNTQIYILDENLQPLAFGEAGELHIAGYGIARGYLNRPDLTQEKFIPNPLTNSQYNRLYKTGDLARYLPDGNIEFLGRIDQQVKIRGLRIELGEITAVLSQHSAVKQALVIDREDIPGNQQLVAYLVAEQIPTQRELRRFLQDKLPDYMVPAAFIFLDTLPLNPNGKIDRSALPVPDVATLINTVNFVAPRNPTEEILAAIWGQVLGLEKVGIADNFFEIGGNSLLATQVISRLRSALSVEIPLRSLFSNPTIASFADAIAQLQIADNSHHQPISQISQSEAIPLSFAQQRVWFIEQLEPNNLTYIIPEAVKLQGQLNIEVLQKSLDAIVAHHAILRTTFITAADGSPIQVIQPPRPVELEIIQLSSPSQISPILNQAAQKPFNLASDLMLRASLLQLDSQAHILVIAMHHIAADGWSMGIFWQQLAAVYAAFLAGKLSPLTPLPIQYADFAIWQRQQLSGTQLESELAYWKHQLADATTVLELPTDKPRSPVQTYRGESHTLKLAPTLSKALTAISRQHHVTLFMTLLAAFGTMLHRYTGQQDILIGSPIAGRNRAELEQLIGFFINTVVLRTSFTGDPNFSTLLAQVRETALAAYAHQDTPFEKLVEQLQIERDTSRHPLFQVWFNMLNLGDVKLELPGLAAEPIAFTETTSKFDLTLYIVEQKQGIELKLVYNADLFSSERMQEMLHQYQHLLTQIVAQPNQKISSYSLVTPTSAALLPQPGEVLAQPEYALVTTLFNFWVATNPQKTAITQATYHWSYQELSNSAHHLAMVLLNYGVQPGDAIALYGTKSFGLIASMLGILLSGGVLVTIDSQLPAERQQIILSAANAKYSIYIDGEHPQQPNTICVDSKTAAVTNNLPSHQQITALPTIQPDDAAYIFFTSGTTGVPKGVLGCHKGLAHFLNWQRQTFNIAENDKVAQLTGLSFDVVLRDIFLPLTSGATLCLPEVSAQIAPDQILHYLQHQQITVLHTVPSLARSWLAHVPPEVTLVNLRWLFFAGEPLPETLIQQWRQTFPASGEIVNLYGPTETTLAKCYYQIPTPPTPGVQPIGLPIPQTQALVLTPHHQLCGIGELGEIVIRTPFRSLGYINNPTENQARFVQNPWSNNEQDLLYFTGDYGRYRPDGLLEILGRRDQQVKIRGIRIELGEIESILTQHPDIFQAVVITREDIADDKRLVAYIIPHAHTVTNINDLRRFLSSQLPQYMVPTAFVTLNTLPLTPNGKLDRRALPIPQSDSQTTYIAPRNQIEQQLAEIWQQILGVDAIGIRDNFFELGGHSLLAAKLFWQIEQKFGQNLPLAILFQLGTIEALAEILNSEQQTVNLHNNWSSLVAIQPQGNKPPLFCVHGLGGEVLCFRELAMYLGTDQPFYGLQAIGLDGKQPPLTKIAEMATHYLQEIKTIQPHGPYFLAGYSFGGNVAFEMAQQLHRQGESVEILVLLDTNRFGSEQRLPFHQRIGEHWQNLRTMRLAYIRQRLEVWRNWAIDNFQRQQYLWKNQSQESALKANYLLDITQNLLETDDYIDIINTNIQAIKEYHYHVYPGRVLLLRTEDKNRLEAVGVQYDPQFGWGELVTGELDIEYIPGSHLNLLQEPFVQVLAKKLRDRLTKIVDATRDH